MRHLIAILAFCAWSLSQAQTEKSKEPALPPTFTTSKGLAVQNGRVIGRNEQGVRIMHDGGLVTVSHAELPAEVAALLGVEQSTNPDAIVLPDPLVAKGKTFLKPTLLSVEPDGIRIRHDGGSAKVGYELLPGSLQISLGGFDPDQAMSFRAAENERQKAVQAEMYQQRMKMIEKSNKEAAGGAAPVDQQPTANLLQNPEVLSQNVLVELSARSLGGKSRDTPYSTNYGSYIKTDTSARNMACTIKSRSSGAQRLRLQCLFLTRGVGGGKLRADIVADTKVEVGANAAKVVTTQAKAENTDAKFVALGLRFKEGEKYVGWSWRAIDGQGRISAVTSSIPVYDKYAWSTALEP
jgi:hypothetical protein